MPLVIPDDMHTDTKKVDWMFQGEGCLSVCRVKVVKKCKKETNSRGI